MWENYLPGYWEITLPRHWEKYLTFTTRVRKGGADLRVTQTLLGHKNLATTQIYTWVDREDLEKAVSLL